MLKRTKVKQTESVMNSEKHVLKTSLVAPWSHGPHYFLEVLQIAAKLTRKKNYKSISVVFVDFGFLKSIYVASIGYYIEIFKRNGSKYPKSLYNNSCSFKKQILNTGECEIHITRYRPRIRHVIKATLQTVYTTVSQIVIPFIITTKKISKKELYHFLLIQKVESVDIGLLAASFSIRNESKAIGSIFKTKSLYSNILNSIYLIFYAKTLAKHKRPSYVTNTEQTYPVDVLRRTLYRHKVKIVDHTSPTSDIKIIEGTKNIPNSFIVEKNLENPSQQIMIECENNLVKRHNGQAELWYQMGKVNKHRLEDSFIRKLHQTTKKEVNCVLFLHSVEDAQYWFGHDGFNDMSEWHYETVRALLKNNNVSNIIVKPHPSIDYDENKCESGFISNFIDYFKGSNKIKTCESSVLIHEFAKIKNPIFITHHGSIAEESVIAGYKTIVSAYAAWKNYPFTYTWTDKDKYLKFLKNLNKDSHELNNVNKQNLLKYSHYYRKKTIYQTAIWLNYMDLLLGCQHPVTPEALHKSQEYLSKITKNDKLFKELLSKRWE